MKDRKIKLDQKMIEKEIIARKGARKAKDIPVEIIRLLNFGSIPTVNLTEWLAVDQAVLIKNTFQKLGLKKHVSKLQEELSHQKKGSTMSSIKLIGHKLYEICKADNTLDKTIERLSNHTSDTIRCYATYLIALNTDLSISEKLKRSKSLIADKHFGVREIVWMALRPEIEKNLVNSINIFTKWARNDLDENIRRFTTESIRPRGVWCKHIESLKENPELALPILETLKSDSSKYVQDSVGNWLNDASKSKPEFVIALCRRWEKESQSKETEKIIKRAMRTINK